MKIRLFLAAVAVVAAGVGAFYLVRLVQQTFRKPDAARPRPGDHSPCRRGAGGPFHRRDGHIRHQLQARERRHAAEAAARNDGRRRRRHRLRWRRQARLVVHQLAALARPRKPERPEADAQALSQPRRLQVRGRDRKGRAERLDSSAWASASAISTTTAGPISSSRASARTILFRNVDGKKFEDVTAIRRRRRPVDLPDVSKDEFLKWKRSDPVRHVLHVPRLRRRRPARSVRLPLRHLVAGH